jgi:phosphoribosyl 1,2-cyclic phosphate phosphodiesterase
LRTAALIERRDQLTNATTTVAIDTGPDFRQQMLNANVCKLDGVVYTHSHADHIHGIDDLRSFFHEQRRRIPTYADAATYDRLYAGFGYCFETPKGSSYPPIVRPNIIGPFERFDVTGDAGPVSFLPLPLVHGDGASLGFRIGDLAYCTDVSAIEPATADALQGLGTLIIDALQPKQHPSHFSLDEALAWIERLRPKRAFLIHMHTPMDYDTLVRETPDNVLPCHDGLEIAIEEIGTRD